jgi:hypothetical protein
MGGVVQSRCVCQLKGHLSETWKPALKKSQLLLMEFATDGVNKSIDKAIKQARSSAANASISLLEIYYGTAQHKPLPKKINHT